MAGYSRAKKGPLLESVLCCFHGWNLDMFSPVSASLPYIDGPFNLKSSIIVTEIHLTIERGIADRKIQGDFNSTKPLKPTQNLGHLP